MDYYKLLDVSKDATQKEIAAAYKKLSKKYHSSTSESDAEILKHITEAYNTLSDEAKREKYDASITKPAKKKISKTSLFLVLGIILIALIAVFLPSPKEKETKGGSMKNTTVDEYITLLNGSTKSYIYIGRTGCEYCQKINPVLTKIINETGMTINYVNIENITQDNYNKLVNSNEILKGDWGTPTLLIVMNGKVVDSHIGYAEYDVIKKFLLEQK